MEPFIYYAANQHSWLHQDKIVVIVQISQHFKQRDLVGRIIMYGGGGGDMSTDIECDEAVLNQLTLLVYNALF